MNIFNNNPYPQMTIPSTYYDEINRLFEKWLDLSDTLSTEVNFERAFCSKGQTAKIVVSWEEQTQYYEIIHSLTECFSKINDEIDTCLLGMKKEHQIVVYLNKLARSYKNINTKLFFNLEKLVDSFKDAVICAAQSDDQKLNELTQLNIGYYVHYMKNRPDHNMFFITVFKDITNLFNNYLQVVRQTILRNLTYKTHKEIIDFSPGEKSILSFANDEITERVTLFNVEFEQNNFLSNEISINEDFRDNESANKLTWKCRPAIAGYIISELINGGYIEEPITNTELSYAKLGFICSQIFSFSGKYRTKADGWRKVLKPDVNELTDFKRAKINIPNAKELD